MSDIEIEKLNLEDTVKALQENTMFRLSLCSKELFHSNYLAYLLEQERKNNV